MMVKMELSLSPKQLVDPCAGHQAEVHRQDCAECQVERRGRDLGTCDPYIEHQLSNYENSHEDKERHKGRGEAG